MKRIQYGEPRRQALDNLLEALTSEQAKRKMEELQVTRKEALELQSFWQEGKDA